MEAATAKLVGTDPAKIVREANLLLDDAAEYSRRARVQSSHSRIEPNPFILQKSLN